MFKFFKKPEDKLLEFMKSNSINLYKESMDLSITLREYAEKLSPEFKSANLYNNDFINKFIKDNAPYRNHLNDVKNTLNSDLNSSDLQGTHWREVYPNAREALSTQKRTIINLLNKIEEIEKYTKKCEELGLDTKIGFDSKFNVD